MDKLIINVALTGMVPTKADNPHVPVTPEEIAADVRRCVDAGASMVHIHARDESGRPTYRKEVYEPILRRVAEVCPDVITCVSCSGRLFRSFEERADVLDAEPRPELASLTLGSMNFAKEASENSPKMISSLALRMQERGVVPEWECFDLGMVEYARYLIKKEILIPPYYCNLLLGNLGTLSATPFNLVAAVNALPAGVTWAAAGIGGFQFNVNAMAITMGGHVRVGLEDNLWYDKEKTRLATNPDLVERLVTVARAVGREPATPAEAREMIGLPPKQSAVTTESAVELASG